MPSTINAQTTPFAAVVTTADNTGNLALQTANVTALTINSSQVVSLANPLPVASGGTGSTSNAAAPFALKGANTDITSLGGLTTALSIAQGGTGASTLTANNVLLGNGTSALQAVAPGTAGNVLTSNGTTWSSTTPAAGFSGATTNAVSSSALTLTNTSTQYQVVQINSVANSIVTLPNATTLATKGYPPFVIENSSPIGANLQVQNATGSVVGYLSVGQVGLFTLIDNSTSAGLWECSTATTQSFFNYNTASLTSNDFGAGLVGYLGLSATSFLRYGYTVTGSSTANLSVTGKFQVATIAGNAITFGTSQTFSILSTSGGGFIQHFLDLITFQVIRLSDSAFVPLIGVAYRRYDAEIPQFTHIGFKNFRTCTVAGTTITFGSASNGAFPQQSSTTNTNTYGSVAYNGTLTRLSDTSFALIFNNAITNTYTHPNNYSGSLVAQIVTVSGTTQTVGTSVALSSSTYTNPLSLAAISDTSLFVAYSQGVAGADLGRTKMNVVSISGTVPTWDTSVTVESADRAVAGNYATVNYALASSATQVIFSTTYSVSVASISGTTPTFVVSPYFGSLGQLYLTTSSKAYGTQGRYLSITTGGFVVSGSITAVNSSGVSASPQAPLGATPTTAYITSDNINFMLGNSL
jgi:hypothetical protein